MIYGKKRKNKRSVKIMKKNNCDILYSNYLIKNDNKKTIKKKKHKFD